MSRIRRTGESRRQPKRMIWRIGMYIRLSREDGNQVSESVENQEKILRSEIEKRFAEEWYELSDSYIDDGTSGTTDVERAAFQRMVSDVQTGRINCIFVKNLSRAFRNSANQGRFLEEFIPLYNTRFVSLYEPAVDTFLNPESVHSLEVSITGFINEQYAYKTSVDVRRTFQYKREKGEFIGAFAPYGYAKDPQDKNVLVIDEEAAQVVRDIFLWFRTEGMSKLGIVKRLNEQATPNPSSYKRAKGFRYHNPQIGKNPTGLWNTNTVDRILHDPIYIGVMRQGRQKVISYKVHKRTTIPEEEWTLVENAVPPIIEPTLFHEVQALMRRDTRAAPARKTVYPFAGLLRCADCGKAMHRNLTRGYVYYYCRTYKEQSKTKCTKHTIRGDVLERAVLAAIQTQIELVESLSEIVDEINAAPVVNLESERLSTMRKAKTRELATASARLDGLYEDWKSGNIDRDQYFRLREKYEIQTDQLKEALERIQVSCDELAKGVRKEDPCLTTFLKCRNVTQLSRGLLVELIDMIYVHEDGSIDIQFNFEDQYRRIAEVAENNGFRLKAAGE